MLFPNNTIIIRTHIIIIIFITTIFFIKFSFSQYEPNWESLDTRPIPLWYDEAKLGIFMHWGVYAVPSFTEWFWWNWQGVKDKSVINFMEKNYKPGFRYADFATQFTAEFFDPDIFAKIIKSSGARYFVLTSKHHEGYTMYPSNYSWNWNSMDVGPHRDLVGELSKSMRQAGIKFGLYFSLFEWFHPLYLKDKAELFQSNDYIKNVVTPQLSEVINLYKPEVIWSDGDWEASFQYWNSTQFLAWLYNSSPVKDTIVTNDRWGVGTLCKHGDFITCTDKYNPGHLMEKKWENCMTVDRDSWGFRRPARYEDYLTDKELIASLVTTISCGGNMLLNVGPTHDGRITPIFEERLSQLGQFVNLNEEAIFGTKPWIYQNDTLAKDVWYTSRLRTDDQINADDPRRLYNYQKTKATIVYAFVLTWPQEEGKIPQGVLELGAVKPTESTKVSLLGYTGSLRYHIDMEAQKLAVDFTSIDWTQLQAGGQKAWVLKLEYLASDKRKAKILKPPKKLTINILRTASEGMNKRT